MMTSTKLYDVLVVGKGPAGISAALYALRANLLVAIVAKDTGALSRAHLISNYYGLKKPISGAELEKCGEEQAKTLGAEFFDDEILDLMYSDCFELKTKNALFKAKTVIIATGSVRSKVSVAGLDALEGKGISYCAVCDGFFYKKKPVAVLGNGEYALAEARELLPLASSVTICTLGKEPLVEIPSEFTVVKEPLDAIEGNVKVSHLKFASGKIIPVEGVFVAIGSASAVDLARKAGAAIENNKLSVDDKLMTSIPGLFAAGDCLGGIMQVAVAVGNGARAGLGVIEFLRNKA